MQASTITFITMRLADSLPREVVQRFDRLRLEHLTNLGIECGDDWRMGRQELSAADKIEFDKRFRRLRELALDDCHGSCVLGHARAAQCVADALLHFDGDRYSLGDFVIMPNHVHCLAAFAEQENMRKVCTSWMRFTARSINRMVGGSGSLWQEEPFDHLVRNEEQLNYLRDYIRDNPIKAGLREGEFLYRRSDGKF